MERNIIEEIAETLTDRDLIENLKKTTIKVYTDGSWTGYADDLKIYERELYKRLARREGR